MIEAERCDRKRSCSSGSAFTEVPDAASEFQSWTGYALWPLLW